LLFGFFAPVQNVVLTVLLLLLKTGEPRLSRAVRKRATSAV
jgi:hypothetical protein